MTIQCNNCGYYYVSTKTNCPACDNETPSVIVSESDGFDNDDSFESYADYTRRTEREEDSQRNPANPLDYYDNYPG